MSVFQMVATSPDDEDAVRAAEVIVAHYEANYPQPTPAEVVALVMANLPRYPRYDSNGQLHHAPRPVTFGHVWDDERGKQ